MEKDVSIREKVETHSSDAEDTGDAEGEKKSLWGRLVGLVAPKKKKKRVSTIYPMR